MATATSKISNHKNAKWYKGVDAKVLRKLHTMTCGGAAVATRRELARALFMEASTISGCVNRLLADGLAVVVPGSFTCRVTGRKVEGLEITQKGISTLNSGDFYS